MFDKFKRWLNCKYEKCIDPHYQYPDPEQQQRQQYYNELQQSIANKKNEHKTNNLLQQKPQPVITKKPVIKKPHQPTKILRDRRFHNNQVAISFR